MSTGKWGNVRPTHEWELLLPLFEWPEQERYEQIRPLVLCDVPVAERAAEVGVSASTLYRRLGGFEAEGMESLFGSEPARRKRLPPAVRRLVVDLKAEHPAFNLNEIRGEGLLRPQTGRPLRKAGPRRGTRAAQDREELPTVPRDRGRAGEKGVDRRAAPLGLEREGDRLLPRGRQGHRVPGARTVEGRRG
jgi:hypothetical protein